MKFRFTKNKAKDIGEQLSGYLSGGGLTTAEKLKLDSIVYATSTVGIKDSVTEIFTPSSPSRLIME
jgi:hypothetical protein